MIQRTLLTCNTYCAKASLLLFMFFLGQLVITFANFMLKSSIWGALQNPMGSKTPPAIDQTTPEYVKLFPGCSLFAVLERSAAAEAAVSAPRLQLL